MVQVYKEFLRGECQEVSTRGLVFISLNLATVTTAYHCNHYGGLLLTDGGHNTGRYWTNNQVFFPEKLCREVVWLMRCISAVIQYLL